jgi:hypothetical protein
MLSMLAQALLLSTCVAVTVNSAAATLACAGGMEAFQSDNRPAGWADADQRFAVWKESGGHHHILCESGVESGKATRTTVENVRTELGLKTGWQSSNPDGEIRVRVTEVNGVELSTEMDGNAAATTAFAPGYDSYKLCGTGDGGDPWEIGDALALRSTYAAVPGFRMKHSAGACSDRMPRLMRVISEMHAWHAEANGFF